MSRTLATSLRVLPKSELDDVALSVRNFARDASRSVAFGESGLAITVEGLAMLDVDAALVQMFGIHAQDVYLPQVEYLKWDYVQTLADCRRQAVGR